MTLRPLGHHDLAAVADVHLQAFPEAAISLFGHEAASRFYRSLLTGPHEQVGFGAFQYDKLVGYLFGGRAIEAERYYLRQNAMYLVTRLLAQPWLILQGRLLSRIGLGLRILMRVTSRPKTLPAPPAAFLRESFGVQVIAVVPYCRRQGIGCQLLQAAETWARQNGYQRMDLSVHVDNHEAIKFYERIGWQKWMHDGVWGGFMFRDLK